MVFDGFSLSGFFFRFFFDRVIFGWDVFSVPFDIDRGVLDLFWIGQKTDQSI